jgi:hypothetical protein
MKSVNRSVELNTKTYLAIRFGSDIHNNRSTRVFRKEVLTPTTITATSVELLPKNKDIGAPEVPVLKTGGR